MKAKPLGNRLSVFLVVKDEERNIDACLKSIQGSGAEIVVVHDGPCADRTLQIAREYTQHVYVHEPAACNNDPLIPFALEQTSGEWVLQMDADERMSAALNQHLSEMISDPSVDAYALYFPFHDPETGAPTVTVKKYKKVLFRKSRMYKVGVPHAQSGTYGREVRSEYALEHHEVTSLNPRGMLRLIIKKNVQRSRITADLLCGSREDIPVFNCSMADEHLSVVRKLTFQRGRPLAALFVMPVYSFYHIYISQGRWRWGGIGLVDSMNVPLFHARTCLCILRRRWDARHGE